MRLPIRIAAACAIALLATSCSSGDPSQPSTWVKKLDTSDRAVKLDALQKLRKLGDNADDAKKAELKKAVSGVVPLLKDTGDVKVEAIKTIADFGDASNVAALIDAIDFSVGSGSDKATKSANDANKEICEALQKFKDKSAIQPLIKVAQSSRDDFVRVAAINALGGIGDPSAVEPLSKLATDESLETYVNKKAVQALGVIGDPAAVPAIVKMMFRERKGVSFYSESSYSAYEIGKAAAGPIVNILEGKDTELKKWAENNDIYPEALLAKAAQVLGDLRDERAAPTLIKDIGYTRPGVAADDIDQLSLLVRMQAAEALGRMRTKEASPVIAKQLKTPEGNTRMAYVRALVEIGDKSVVPQLIACAQDGDVMDNTNHARTACYVGLSQLGEEKAWSTWQDWEKKEPEATKKACLKQMKFDDAEGKTLAEKHCTLASDNIVKALKDNESRLAAYNECKQDVSCWDKKLKDKDPKVRERAAFELGRIDDKAGMPGLMAALHDDDLNARYAAIMAVDWIASSSKEGLELAKKGLTDLDKQIVDEAGKVQFAKINEDLKRLSVKIRRLERIGS